MVIQDVVEIRGVSLISCPVVKGGLPMSFLKNRI
jgi:hypothetical protein